MASTLMFAFAIVFVMAVLFLVLMITRRSKYYTPIYAVLSAVFWFALGGLQLLVFDPSISVLSFLWYVVGVVSILTGLILTLVSMKADKEDSEMTL